MIDLIIWSFNFKLFGKTVYFEIKTCQKTLNKYISNNFITAYYICSV